MKEIAERFEEAFRQLGVQLGRELAARLLEASAEAKGDGPQQKRQRPQQAVAPTEPPGGRILPGLTGRRRRPGDPPPPCGRAGCTKPARTRGYCQTHYVQWLKAGEARRHAG